MGPADDLRELRSAQGRLSARIDGMNRNQADDHGDVVGHTIAMGGPFPTTIGAYYWIQPCRIQGNETNGSPASLTDDPAATPILGLCLGPNAPGLGAAILVSTSTEGRYVFQS